MKNSQEIITQIQKAGIFAILPGDIPLQTITEIGDALLASPVLGVEVQLRNKQGEQLIADLKQRARAHMVVGAGDVQTIAEADASIQAGAQFISSQRLDFELMSYCKEQNVLYLPGVISVLAAQAVQQAGGNMVRLRTGGTGGPDFVAAMRQAIPGLHVIVTGDISAQKIGDYAQSGADAVLVDDVLFTGASQTMADLITKARMLQKVWDAGLGRRSNHLVSSFGNEPDPLN